MTFLLFLIVILLCIIIAILIPNSMLEPLLVLMLLGFILWAFGLPLLFVIRDDPTILIGIGICFVLLLHSMMREVPEDKDNNSNLF